MIEGGRKSIRTLTVNDLKALYEALGNEGNSGYLSESRVEIMVVYAYASWCGFCQKGMPVFNEQALKTNSKIAFFFNASTPDRRAEFKRITGRDINKFPTIFVFYGTPQGRRVSEMIANGNYSAKLQKLNQLMS